MERLAAKSHHLFSRASTQHSEATTADDCPPTDMHRETETPEDDWSLAQRAIDAREGLEEATPIGRSRAVRFPDLRAEYSLNTWLARYSLLELRKMLRASRPDLPLPQCLPPLGAPILQTTNMALPLVTHSSTEGFIFNHLLISFESFLASLSLLERGSLS